MKIGYSQSKNVKQLKNIIQTLSKEIPNTNNYPYLTEFNNIQNNVKALKFLDKRLQDMIPKTRYISYNIISKFQYRSEDYSNDIIVANLYSKGNWKNEHDTTRNKYQYKRAYINDYIYFNLSNTDVSNIGNSINLGYINEENTNNYTEIHGIIPCAIVPINDVKRTITFLKFEEQNLLLCSNDWSFLSSDRKAYILNFNGFVDYKSYENYTPKA